MQYGIIQSYYLHNITYNFFQEKFSLRRIENFMTISCVRPPMALQKCLLEISPPYLIGSPQFLGRGLGQLCDDPTPSCVIEKEADFL